MTSTTTPERLHRLLAASHGDRLSPQTGTSDWERALQREFDVRLIEHRFVESERKDSEVLLSLVQETPEVAPCIAEGALLRLRAGARCFERYKLELWGGSASRHEPRLSA